MTASVSYIFLFYFHNLYSLQKRIPFTNIVINTIEVTIFLPKFVMHDCSELRANKKGLSGNR